jgi:DNA-binding NarL/FixJ family response regulator
VGVAEAEVILTPRQQQVLELADASRTYAEIAETLGISSFTVATTLRAARDRIAAAELGPRPISSRQRQVATLYAGGSTIEQMAAALQLSSYTIKANLHSVHTRLGTHNRRAVAELLGVPYAEPGVRRPPQRPARPIEQRTWCSL